MYGTDLETKHHCGSIKVMLSFDNQDIRSGNEDRRGSVCGHNASGDWRSCRQRQLAHMPSAAIGGHAASGDLAVMPSEAIGAHAVSMNRQSLPRYPRFDTLF